MKERPILFSGPMVRAILEGRKTQTRRVMNPQPKHSHVSQSQAFPLTWYAHGELGIEPEVWNCPYGVSGDRLWVRETWGIGGHGRLVDPCLNYRADGAQTPLNDGLDIGWYVGSRPLIGVDDASLIAIRDGWRPSIHMPRWASRITLEITDVRVQRLQEISHRDALAEGVSYDVSKTDGSPYNRFHALWDSTYGKKHPWATNPWVWALTFQRINPQQ